MANYGGFSFTGFSGVNLRNTAAIRFEMGGVAGTLSGPTSGENLARAWSLPDKSGRFPISGTFSVDLPAIGATTVTLYSTAVTVSGIRAEDGLTVVRNSITASYLGSSARIFMGAVPGNGSITLHFLNVGAAGNGTYGEVWGYTAVR